MKTVLCQHGSYSDATWCLLDIPNNFDFEEAYKKFQDKCSEEDDWCSPYGFLDWLQKNGCEENKTIPIVDLDLLGRKG